MAESPSSPSSSSNPSPTSSTSGTTHTSGTTPLSGGSAPQSKQYIRSSIDDNALEPDALRGSEHIVRDLKIQDDEEDRRQVYKEDKDKDKR